MDDGYCFVHSGGHHKFCGGAEKELMKISYVYVEYGKVVVCPHSGDEKKCNIGIGALLEKGDSEESVRARLMSQCKIAVETELEAR